MIQTFSVIDVHVGCLVKTFVEEFESACINDYSKRFVSPACRLTQRGRRTGGVVCCISHSIAKFAVSVRCTADNVLVFKI